jgi:hypothetical protein
VLAEAVQAATEQHMVLDFVDQDDTGDDAMAVAAEHGIRLDVINLLEAKRGFVLRPGAGWWSAPLS